MGKKGAPLRAAELAEHFVKRYMERVVKNAIVPDQCDLPLCPVPEETQPEPFRLQTNEMPEPP